MNRFLITALLLFVAAKSGLCMSYECVIFSKYVHYISLHCEGLNITHIPVTTHSNLVIEYHLQNNLIQAIEKFPPMATLQFLNLSHNVISNLSWESMGSFPDLLRLDLSYNRLTYVDMSARKSLAKTLILFKVSNNNLETFSEENLGIFPSDFDSATSTYKPYVEGNPLRCDCRLFWLQKLTQANEKCQLSSRDHVMACKEYHQHPLYLSLLKGPPGFKCHSPENMRGMPLFKVDLSKCDVPTAWYNVSLPTLLKVLGSVAAGVVFIPLAVVLKRKCRVSRRSGEASPPPPVLIPLPPIQNSLQGGNNSGDTDQN
ncbi:PREDICTED: leucine-rich repeat and fibronectin type III domain-containing protein 1-like [Branchiostoma belcheri]|uniref:Leucine-rich repeat and fibronectin type III domain-containing protein 1-like n=1 Tax=Branchiostoma belcheri TaxID=7741 RepID=A0A6P4ZPG8_BRABE|nr:PREDICTED: leucine-rich repeat and fibronectin type III domain-containing protein 1-like [Branchiostoma belcheri]